MNEENQRKALLPGSCYSCGPAVEGNDSLRDSSTSRCSCSLRKDVVPLKKDIKIKKVSRNSPGLASDLSDKIDLVASALERLGVECRLTCKVQGMGFTSIVDATL